MYIESAGLVIRNAGAEDAEILCAWWNDGEVMRHAGFPNGLGTTAEKIRESLKNDSDETHRRHIIALDAVPIGEMNYRNKGGKTAEIGIKICDTSKQNHGLGTKILRLFIQSLFADYGYEKIVLDTNLKNECAQHVYEKIGFEKTGITIDSWKNQIGELQSAVYYALEAGDFIPPKK